MQMNHSTDKLTKMPSFLAKGLDPILTGYLPLLKLTWRTHRTGLLSMMLLYLAGATLPALSTLALQSTLTLFTNFAQTQVMRLLLVGIVIQGGVHLAQSIHSRLSSIVQYSVGEQLRLRIQHDIQNVVFSKRFHEIESPAYQDKLQRAQVEAHTRPMAALSAGLNFVSNIFSIAALSAVVGNLHWLVPVYVVIGAIPGLFVSFIYSRRTYELVREQTQDQRRLSAIQFMLVDPSYGKELRIFGLLEFFRRKHDPIYWELFRRQYDHRRRSVTRELLVSQSCQLLALAGSLYVVGATLLDNVSMLGVLAATLQGVNLLQRRIVSTAGAVGSVYEHAVYAKELIEFITGGTGGKWQGYNTSSSGQEAPALVVSEVVFSYSGRTEWQLDRISFKVEKGETVAIVGENGAGKSTLVKLICGLYQPNSGVIELLGRQVRPERNGLPDGLVVMFQDFNRYFGLSLRENISFEEAVEGKEEEILRSVGGAGIIERSPKGIETVVGRAFGGGIDLSGGEWQRIALARTAMRQADLVILDEPTSAIDPKTERDVMQRMFKITEGKTRLLITHRLGWVRWVDRVLVMSNGSIVESGSHEELMKRRGSYYEMYVAQAELYDSGSAHL